MGHKQGMSITDLRAWMLENPQCNIQQAADLTSCTYGRARTVARHLIDEGLREGVKKNQRKPLLGKEIRDITKRLWDVYNGKQKNGDTVEAIVKDSGMASELSMKNSVRRFLQGNTIYTGFKDYMTAESNKLVNYASNSEKQPVYMPSVRLHNKRWDRSLDNVHQLVKSSYMASGRDMA